MKTNETSNLYFLSAFPDVTTRPAASSRARNRSFYEKALQVFRLLGNQTGYAEDAFQVCDDGDDCFPLEK